MNRRTRLSCVISPANASVKSVRRTPLLLPRETRPQNRRSFDVLSTKRIDDAPRLGRTANAHRRPPHHRSSSPSFPCRWRRRRRRRQPRKENASTGRGRHYFALTDFLFTAINLSSIHSSSFVSSQRPAVSRPKLVDVKAKENVSAWIRSGSPQTSGRRAKRAM